MRIAVLIPCYNEAQTIETVVKDYHAALPEADIYVYDNNSTDGTAEIAEKAGAIVRYERRQGKGNVIRTMFREIDADCYIMTDGDDTYPAENAPEMARLILEENADFVVGDRLSSTYFTENNRKYHNTGNKTVKNLVNTFFGGSFSDIMTGYHAFSPLFVKTFPVLSHGFEIETEMAIHALDKNMNIREVVVEYRDRPEGSESKLNTVSDGMKVIFTIASLFKNYKPFQFFGIISGIFGALALIIFLFVMKVFLATGELRVPSLIGVGFLFISGILTLVCGLILNTVVNQHKRDFESNLNMLELTWRMHREGEKKE